MKNLSRECIRDTLLVKRLGLLKKGGLLRALYVLNIQTLRAGQLAPHTETRMLPGRYLDRQSAMRTAPEIVIVVRGGLVQEVRSTNPYTTVYIADYDTDHDDPDEDARLSEAEERGNAPDMTVVY